MVLLLTLLAGPASAVGIPDVLYRVEDPSGPPGWISKQKLDEEMNASRRPAGSRLEAVSDLLMPRQRLPSSLENYREAKEFQLTPDGKIEECEPQIISYYYEERAKDLGRLIELSEVVLRVRVVDSKPGFLSAMAGELLEAKVLAVLKDGGAFPVPSDFLYLFDRYARMVIDGQPICLGLRPVPEGEFLFFLVWEPIRDLGFPTAFLDNGALIAADGVFFGSLLDDAVKASELERNLAEVEQLILEEEKQ